MKKLSLIIFSVTALLMGQNFASAQAGRFGDGPDSAECKVYLSYYQEYYKQKNYDSALPNWRKAYAICPPTASQNMFVHGTSLMNRYRSTVKDPFLLKAIEDTILTLQDQRLANYPRTAKGVDQKPTILNNKGQYMINFRGNDSRYIYNNLLEIVNVLGNKTRGGLLVNLLQSSITLYREGELVADDVIAVYDKVSEAINGATAKNDAEAEDNARAKSTIETIFADSKVASCDNLIAIFSPRVEADPENIALLQNVVKLMNNAEDCTNNDLYFSAVTTMYKLDPSYRSAYALFRMNSSRGNVADAGRYLEEAIASEESDEATDAQYTYELAIFAYRNGMRGKAAEAARKAVDLDCGYAGKAYMILGNPWSSSTCTDEVDKYARFWAATDYYQKARNADYTLSEDAASSIAGIAKYYPEASEIFMYDLTAGQSYTVSCGGLTATTTVRVSNR